MVDATQEPEGESPWSFQGPDFSALKSQWDQTLADPRGQAALLSFAAQALQPRQFGQSSAGLIGESSAKGGEAIRSIDTQEEKAKELASRQDLRESQGQLAEQRANTATTRTDLAGANLALREKDVAHRGDVSRMQGTIGAQNAYQKYRAQIDLKNKQLQKDSLLDPKLKTQIQEPLNLQDWLTANPQMGQLYYGGQMPQTGQGSAATTPQTDWPPPSAGGTPPAPGTADPWEGKTANKGAVIRQGGKWIVKATGQEYKP